MGNSVDRKAVERANGPGPVEYASSWGDVLYGWQQDAMNRVWAGEQVALRTCNSSGKTSRVIADLGLAIMARWPGARIVSTSASWTQIETQLWPELKTKVSEWKTWTWNKREIVGPVVEIGGKQFQSTWTPFSTDDPKRAEGHHDRWIPTSAGEVWCPVAYFIDEAKGVDDGIFDAQGRCRAGFKLVASSPGEDAGAFFECFNRYAALWHPVVVDWTMCPHLHEDAPERKRIEAEIKAKGRENPLIKSQYFGEFFRHSGYFVFPEVDTVRWAMGGMVPKVGGDRAAAFDWSQGGDEQVWGVREGNHVIEWQQWHIKDSVVLAKRLKSEMQRWSLTPRDCVFDAGGGGKDCIQLLESWGYQGIQRYMNNEPARDKTIYANRYTEDCFERVAERLKTLALPKDDVLERQMRERQYIMPNDDSNRRRLQPKEELRRKGKESPDRLDCIIMLFSNHRAIDAKTWQYEQSGMNRCPTRDEVWKRHDDEAETTMAGGWRGDVFD